MNQEVQNVNTIAPLQNVSRCMVTLEKAIKSPAYVPHIVALYGYSGFGKSTAAAYVANNMHAYYIEVKDTWSKKAFLRNILVAMGIDSSGTMDELADKISQELAVSDKPLIIDEFDYIVEKGYVDTVRSLYDGSGNMPMMIIGEEFLEGKLRKWEKFHNRVLDWVPAEPCSLKDGQHLRELYCDKVTITDDLLNRIIQVCKGNASRTCINLYNIQEFGLLNGMTTISLKDWGKQPLFNGTAPKRRAL